MTASQPLGEGGVPLGEEGAGGFPSTPPGYLPTARVFP